LKKFLLAANLTVIQILTIAILYGLGKYLTNTYASKELYFFFAYVTGVITISVQLAIINKLADKNKKGE
jgi:hypothetical protein